MSNYDNTNRFTLGKNRKKEKETQADFTGKINVVCPHCNQGSDHWLNGWVKEHNGEKFFSGNVKKKEDGHAVPFAKKAVRPSDDMPF